VFSMPDYKTFPPLPCQEGQVSYSSVFKLNMPPDKGGEGFIIGCVKISTNP